MKNQTPLSPSTGARPFGEQVLPPGEIQLTVEPILLAEQRAGFGNEVILTPMPCQSGSFPNRTVTVNPEQK
jgi:hypothetical protein